MKKIIFFGAIFVALLFFPLRRGISLVEEKNLFNLTNEADTIIIGKVTYMKSEWNHEKTFIYTHITISIDEYIKGGSKEKEITIQIPGGKVGEICQVTSDTPQVKVGEKILLFLRREYFRIVGWFQGKFSIKKDEVSGEEIIVSEETMPIYKNGKIIVSEKIRMPLSDFIVQIKDIMARQE